MYVGVFVLETLQYRFRNRPLQEMSHVDAESFRIASVRRNRFERLVCLFQRRQDHVVDQHLLEAELLQAIGGRDALQQHCRAQTHLGQHFRLLFAAVRVQRQHWRRRCSAGQCRIARLRGRRIAHVRVQLMLVFRLEERMAAGALVGFVHAVDGSHVRFQVGQLREGRRFGADDALEGFFAGVLANVQLQDAGVGERVPAYLR